METYEGECLGGPWRGKKLAHWAKTKKLFRAKLDWESKHVMVEHGEYRLGDFHHWHWFEATP